MIETVPSTGSTNVDLVRRIAQGEDLAEGYWLRAEQQTGGKGRLGRTWISPPGNLYCSTVVHIVTGDPPAHTLSFVSALALHDALSSFMRASHGLQLKWPNDAQVGGAKIAGVLLERSQDRIVAGIGINVAYSPVLPDRLTTYLRDYCPDADCGALLANLARAFAKRLQNWRREGVAATLAAWEGKAHSPGELLTVTGPHGERMTGTYTGLGPDGSLQLRLPDGRLTAIYAGDVSRP